MNSIKKLALLVFPLLIIYLFTYNIRIEFKNDYLALLLTVELFVFIILLSIKNKEKKQDMRILKEKILVNNKKYIRKVRFKIIFGHIYLYFVYILILAILFLSLITFKGIVKIIFLMIFLVVYYKNIFAFNKIFKINNNYHDNDDKYPILNKILNKLKIELKLNNNIILKITHGANIDISKDYNYNLYIGVITLSILSEEELYNLLKFRFLIEKNRIDLLTVTFKWYVYKEEISKQTLFLKLFLYKVSNFILRDIYLINDVINVNTEKSALLHMKENSLHIHLINALMKINMFYIFENDFSVNNLFFSKIINGDYYNLLIEEFIKKVKGKEKYYFNLIKNDSPNDIYNFNKLIEIMEFINFYEYTLNFDFILPYIYEIERIKEILNEEIVYNTEKDLKYFLEERKNVEYKYRNLDIEKLNIIDSHLFLLDLIRLNLYDEALEFCNKIFNKYETSLICFEYGKILILKDNDEKGIDFIFKAIEKNIEYIVPGYGLIEFYVNCNDIKKEKINLLNLINDYNIKYNELNKMTEVIQVKNNLECYNLAEIYKNDFVNFLESKTYIKKVYILKKEYNKIARALIFIKFNNKKITINEIENRFLLYGISYSIYIVNGSMEKRLDKIHNSLIYSKKK